MMDENGNMTQNTSIMPVLDQNDPKTWHPVILTFCLIVSAFILSTNLFVLYFWYNIKEAELRKRVSMILTLCFSDIILGIAGTVFSLYRIVNVFNKFFCILAFFLQEVGATASLIHTFSICLERFLAVNSKTLQKSIFGRRGRYVFMAISWIIICLYVGCKKLLVPGDMSVCTLPDIYGLHYYTTIRVYAVGILLPLLIGTVALYIITLCLIRSKRLKINPVNVHLKSVVPSQSSMATDKSQHLRSNSSSCQNDGNLIMASTSRNVDRQKKVNVLPKTQRHTISSRKYTSQHDKKFKAMRNIGLIVLVMVLTTGTGSLFLTVEALCEECIMTINLRAVLAFLWFFNSAINPLIYILTIDEFRGAVKKTIKCQKI